MEQRIYRWMHRRFDVAFVLSLAALSGPDQLQQVVLSPVTACTFHPVQCCLAGPGTSGASLSIAEQERYAVTVRAIYPDQCFFAGPGTVDASHLVRCSLAEREHAVRGCPASTVLLHPVQWAGSGTSCAHLQALLFLVEQVAEPYRHLGQ